MVPTEPWQYNLKRITSVTLCNIKIVPKFSGLLLGGFTVYCLMCLSHKVQYWCIAWTTTLLNVTLLNCLFISTIDWMYITTTHLVVVTCTWGICLICMPSALWLRHTYHALSPRASVIHIRQITNAHVTSVMHHFVAIATTPVVWIPKVIAILLREAGSTNC